MLDALRRPLALPVLIAGTVAAALVVAVYCVAYTTLAGRSESFAQSLAWAVAHVCPWLLAVEGGKRAISLGGAAAWLGAALIASLALGYALAASNDALAFETIRCLPGLAAATLLIGLLRSGLGRASARPTEIPLLPSQIDWVRAAGNYIELRAAGQTIVHRLPIGSAERELAPHGFIRIHRSLLVRRDRIARIRPQDVVLIDGTHLKVGKRYRTALAA